MKNVAKKIERIKELHAEKREWGSLLGREAGEFRTYLRSVRLEAVKRRRDRRLNAEIVNDESKTILSRVKAWVNICKADYQRREKAAFSRVTVDVWMNDEGRSEDTETAKITAKSLSAAIDEAKKEGFKTLNLFINPEYRESTRDEWEYGDGSKYYFEIDLKTMSVSWA